MRAAGSLLLSLLPLLAEAQAAGGGPLVRVEPPSPNAETPWKQVRGEQLSFIERLEEWGIRVEVERKDELPIEKSPNLFTLKMSWETPTKTKIEFGLKTPENPLKESASFSYEAVIGENGLDSSSTKGEWECNGQKFSGGITSDAQRGLGYEVGFEIERAYLALKGKLDSTAPELVSYAAEVSLTKLYNAAQGLAGASHSASNVKIKIDPLKYVRRFREFAPRFVDFASRPASAAANAVSIGFNPVLLAAAAADDVSLWSRQKAALSVRQALQTELPKGVKIHFNDRLLAEMLQKSGDAQGRAGLHALADALEQAADPRTRETLVGEYIRQLKRSYRAGQASRAVPAVTLVSLRSLVTRAEPFAAAWNDLPAELRMPGGIARVVGYQLDQAHDDVLLIGERIPGAPVLSIDDLIVGVRTVWKENATPFCSLDPDPADVGGDQHVRVSGVPADSGFALAMLDADYLMKRMLAGLAKVESPGYEAYLDMVRQRVKEGLTKLGSNRFWFYPTPLQTGDIELSPDGTVVLFNTGMQVLSEQMVLSREALTGTGNVDATADQWAAGLTKALPDLEPRHPEYQHLHGLFDLVLLAKTWQKMQVESPWIARLTALPYQKVNVPASYTGVRVEVAVDGAPGGGFVLRGGVHVRTAASLHACLVEEQPGLAAMRAAAGLSEAMVRPVPGPGLVLAAGTRRQAGTMDVAAVLQLIRRNDLERALVELQKLIQADPFDPDPWCLRAIVYLQKREYGSVLAAAERALNLDPENPGTVLLASSLRFQAHLLSGRPDAALSDIDAAILQLPDSSRAYVLKAEALAALGRGAEARSAYRQALKLDPASVLANVSFGLMEISEGWVVRGKKLIEKAKSQMRGEADVPAVKAAMAFAEMAVAVLGDAEEHLSASRRLAAEVLAAPGSDPPSRLKALAVHTILALSQEDVPAADGYLQQGLALAPASPGLLLLVVGWAHEAKKDDLARRYLDRAEKIAPDYPAVKDFRRILGGTR
jgi:Tfp pilus assembly protein PilF